MKKKYIMFLLLLVLLIVVSSCNKSNLTEGSVKQPNDKTQEAPVDTFDVGVGFNSIDYSKYSLNDYIVGILDHSDSAPVSANFGTLTKIYDEDLYKNIVPSEEKTVVIDGEEVTGLYERTYNRPKTYYPQYKYMIYDHKGSFAVDDVGRIVSYINYETIDNTGTSLTQEECITIAKDLCQVFF